MLACPLPKWLAARTLLIVIALAAGLGAAALLAVFGLPYGRSHPKAFAHVYTFPGNGNMTHLHIDADITNGSRPCDPIDTETSVVVGSVHKVGVCIEDYDTSGEPKTGTCTEADHSGCGTGSIEAFELHIRYSGDPDAIPPTTINSAPTTMAIRDPAHGWSCLTPDPNCLNANPDANDGDDVNGYKLGAGWSCTGFGFTPPLGEDPDTPGVADAEIVCNSNVTDPDNDLVADPGLLATIEFTASGTGIDTIDFGPIDGTHGGNVVGIPNLGGTGFAYCGTTVPADQIGCFGATIHKVAAPPAIPSQVLSPVVGDLEMVSSLEECTDTKWCFNQHGSCDPTGVGHCPGGGVCHADDTYAWDANLNTPTTDSDAGKPVYAVGQGVVAETYGECTNGDGGSCGQLLIEHDSGGSIWWSGYLHMTNIQVGPGTPVNANTVLGYVSDVGASNNHLHFVIYTGENNFGGLVSFDARIVPRIAWTSLIAAAAAGATDLQVGSGEGFAPGDLVRINPGGPNAEDSWIASIGSLILAWPLRFAHEAGEPIVKIPAAPVGGIAELPDVASTSAEKARAPADGSRWWADRHAALASGLAAAVLAVAAAWHARRRWLR